MTGKELTFHNGEIVDAHREECPQCHVTTIPTNEGKCPNCGYDLEEHP